MALLDRVKTRVETDLSDTELELLIAEAQAEIVRRWGPDRDTEAPITVTVDGGGAIVDLKRPLDADEDVVVVEHQGYGFVSASEDLTLATDDYEIRNGGRTLARLSTGTNSSHRWGYRASITYVPADDQPQRDEVVIKLVKLAIQHEEVSSERVGDTQTSHLDYTEEREKLIGSLNPRPGLLLA